MAAATKASSQSPTHESFFDPHRWSIPWWLNFILFSLLFAVFIGIAFGYVSRDWFKATITLPALALVSILCTDWFKIVKIPHTCRAILRHSVSHRSDFKNPSQAAKEGLNIQGEPSRGNEKEDVEGNGSTLEDDPSFKSLPEDSAIRALTKVVLTLKTESAQRQHELSTSVEGVKEKLQRVEEGVETCFETVASAREKDVDEKSVIVSSLSGNVADQVDMRHELHDIRQEQDDIRQKVERLEEVVKGGRDSSRDRFSDASEAPIGRLEEFSALIESEPGKWKDGDLVSDDYLS
jgi:hypothetical protein